MCVVMVANAKKLAKIVIIKKDKDKGVIFIETVIIMKYAKDVVVNTID